MDDFTALSELRNQQRPVRRNDKTYGKKKTLTAERRAMHFDLFGGDRDENNFVSNSAVPEDEEDVVEGVKRLTVADHAPVVDEPSVFESTSTPMQKHHEKHPRLRGRRKATSHRKMAPLTPERLHALAPLLTLVEQDGVKDFQEFGRGIGKKYICTKLGEGSYADVYKLESKDLEAAVGLEQSGGVIVKVIPFQMVSLQTDDIADLDSVMREIKVMQTVDALHGFVRCRGIHIVSGVYPDVFLEAFDAFKGSHSSRSAVNPNPLLTAAPQQLYAILEMSDAGSPLGKLRGASAFQAFDIFWKTAISLALAEKEVEFEHRDLHNGNICWKPLRKDGPSDVEEETIQEMTEKPEAILGMSNLDVTIIDYTLSRVTIRSETGDDVVVFDPMEYWEQDFTGEEGGSEIDNHQWRTYAAVREWAKGKEAEAQALATPEDADHKGRDKYARFIPKSNVLWLRYVLADVLARGGGGGRGGSLPGSSRAAKKLQGEVWRTLEEASGYLNGTAAMLLPESADDLVALAVERGWLASADVAAFEAQIRE